MFTGLVEDVGVLASLQHSANEVRLTIRSQRICAGLAIGDSVSVNGACLTAVDVASSQFIALATAETLRRTALNRLSAGSRVNLERALRLGDRLGGHLVLGHVDGIGNVQRLSPEGEALRMEIEVPDHLLPMLVPKGSIAIDGVSLTIADLLPNGFWVALIPHTIGATTIQDRKQGDAVNLETDIIGKYVARLLGRNTGGEGIPLPPDQARGKKEGSLTIDLLRENGFA